MTIEHNNIPDWARQERQVDMEWIQENADIFHVAARLAFQVTGRGAIIVDTTVQPIPGGGHPFGYFDKETVTDALDEDTQRMVREYDPEQEVILVLLKEEERTSTYRFRSVPPGE